MRFLVNGLILGLLCISSLTAQDNFNIIMGQKFESQAEWPVLDENIAHYSLYTIDVQKPSLDISPSNSRLVINLGDQFFDLNMFDNNVMTSVEYANPPLLLGGATRFGGSVALTVNDNFINGFIKFGNSNTYFEKLKNFDKSAPDNVYVVYDASAVIETGEHECGVETTKYQTEQYQDKSLPTTMCKIIDLAIADTYDMVVAEGSVTAVINHNLAVLNNVQINYRSEFDANLEFDVVAHFVPASNGADPFPSTTNAGTLLSFLDNWGNGGGNSGGSSGGFGVDYTQASLWTDRNITYGGSSGVVGLAQTPGWHHVLENYTSSAASLKAMVSHEKGHNFSALHDAAGSNFIMAPSVTITENWSSASVSDINSRISSQGYLQDCSTMGSPNADFTQSAIAVCPGSSVDYEDQSQYGATRDWTFFGGTPSSSTDAKESVTYNTTGLWAVKLVSDNGAGAGPDSILKYVDVQNEPFTNVCTPNGIGGNGGITSFALENINNTSSGSSSSNDYQNFICGNVALLAPNTTYDFTVSIGNCSGGCNPCEVIRLYIDYNGDEDFTDSGELAYTSGGSGWCGTVTNSFTTPAAPQLGEILRLRVIVDNSFVSSPCHDPSTGEVEDYGVYFETTQIFGCTDPAASNYDPAATIDDGSCVYGSTTWYQDLDSDSFGNPNVTQNSANQPAGFVADNTDCDDTDNTVYPGAPELCDGQINNCNTGSLPSNEIDNDGDGYVECVIDAGGWDGNPSVVGGNDCDDTDANNYPGNTEVCDGQDNDCDGLIDEGVLTTFYRDLDNDTWGDLNITIQACTQPIGFVQGFGDCDDTEPTVYPGAPELCDGQINNCNTTSLPEVEVDNDNDGYVECTIDAGGWDGNPSVIGGDDCNDNNSNQYPGNPEVCDGLDNDCDGMVDEGLTNTYYRDLDGDSYGDPQTSVQACTPPGGYVTDNSDCDDNNAAINPAANEVCDSVDNDCDGIVDEGCQTCDGDYLVIHTITQDAYHAQFTITSDAIVNNGQTVDFFAGEAIILDPDFEVTAGTVFRAVIADCVPNTAQENEDTEFLKASSIETLVEIMRPKLDENGIEMRILDSTGSELENALILDSTQLDKKLQTWSKNIEPGMYRIVFRKDAETWTQRVMLTDQ